MKKTFWRKLIKKRRNSKKKSSVSLTVSKGPKKHKSEPDRWKPPFAATQKIHPFKANSQDLIVVNKPNGFEIGKVTATVGIMLQARIDCNFQFFVDECLERFRNLDWGIVNENERVLNDRKVMTQTGTIYGVYAEPSSGIQIWIVTDLDQDITRICLSDEC